MPATISTPGTLSLSDLLRVNNTSIIDFGRFDVFRVLREFVEAYTRLVNEQLALFTERTQERVIGTGGTATMQARYTDEFGVVDPQKVTTPVMLGFPLRKSQITLQWTYQWMRKHTPQEMAAQIQAAVQADMAMVQSALRKAIFTATNNNSYVDTLRDYMTIPVKAFANADGFPIPASPNAVVFNPATHTHYLGTANAQPSAADIDALLGNVTEHSNAKPILLVPQTTGNYIYANKTSYPNFVPLVYDGQVTATTLTYAVGRLDYANPANRQLGLYNGAEVWIKPWVPATAIAAFSEGPVKPIAMRVPDDLGGDNGDFRLVFEDDQYPMQCQLSEREFGFAPQNRVGGAVLSFGGADTTYVQPSGL